MLARYLSLDVKLDDECRRLDELARKLPLRFAARPWASYPESESWEAMLARTIAPEHAGRAPRDARRDWPDFGATVESIEHANEPWARVAIYEDLVLRQPRVAVFWWFLGKNLTSGRPDVASVALARAIELAPRDPEPYFYLANARRALGRYEDALELLRRARERDAINAWYAIRQAEVLVALERFADAAGVLETLAVQPDPLRREGTDTKYFWRLRGDLARRLGDRARERDSAAYEKKAKY